MRKKKKKTIQKPTESYGHWALSYAQNCSWKFIKIHKSTWGQIKQDKKCINVRFNLFYLIIWMADNIFRWLHIAHSSFIVLHILEYLNILKQFIFSNVQVQVCLHEIHKVEMMFVFFFLFILKQTRALFTFSFSSVININECIDARPKK